MICDIRPGLNMEESFQTMETEAQLSTSRWLDYRQKVAKKVQFPVNHQQQVRNNNTVPIVTYLPSVNTDSVFVFSQSVSLTQ